MKPPFYQAVPYPGTGLLPRLEGGGPYSAWFESMERGVLGGRYSYLLWDPFRVIEWGFDGSWKSRVGRSAADLTDDPFEGLEEVLSRLPTRTIEDLPPFQGGVAGSFSYELASRLEHLPRVGSKRALTPPARWAVGDVVMTVDHARRRAWIVSQGWPEAEGASRERRARARLERAVHAWNRACEEEVAQQTFAVPRVPLAAGNARAAADEGVEASLDSKSYRDRFSRLYRFLQKGHVYQANLSVSYRVDRKLEPWDVFRALTRSSPAPYASLLGGEEVSVVSASPELFLRRRGSRLVTRPIKGTRRRSASPSEDDAAAAELLASEKDMAEHVMIVDVHRNDLGRVARYGSVRVSEPWKLESFATLHHMTSTVEADERDGLRLLDPIRAAFPAGSITGAPKIRAMEILADLEPHARGVFTGAIGWICPGGDFDFSVGIRTLTVTDSLIEFPAGGGIVIDSDVEAEYQESWDKARSLWSAVQSASETTPVTDPVAAPGGAPLALLANL